MENVRPTVRNIARHMAQHNGAKPKFFPFEERNEHDLDALATQMVDREMTRLEEREMLEREYGREDKLWSSLYPDFEQFEHSYDQAVRRVLDRRKSPNDETSPDDESPTIETLEEDHPDPREPTEEIKQEVVDRDRWRCLCCDYDRESALRVDHVRPYVMGGESIMENLQTLCTHCNREKGESHVDFRNHQTPLESPKDRLVVDRRPPDTKSKAKEPDWWHHYLARVINFFYECDAVKDTTIRKRGTYFHRWEVQLFGGNDPNWIAPHLEEWVDFIRDHRSNFLSTPAPRELILCSRGEPKVGYDAKKGELVEEPEGV